MPKMSKVVARICRKQITVEAQTSPPAASETYLRKQGGAREGGSAARLGRARAGARRVVGRPLVLCAVGAAHWLATCEPRSIFLACTNAFLLSAIRRLLASATSGGTSGIAILRAGGAAHRRRSARRQAPCACPGVAGTEQPAPRPSCPIRQSRAPALARRSSRRLGQPAPRAAHPVASSSCFFFLEKKLILTRNGEPVGRKASGG